MGTDVCHKVPDFQTKMICVVKLTKLSLNEVLAQNPNIRYRDVLNDYDIEPDINIELLNEDIVDTSSSEEVEDNWPDLLATVAPVPSRGKKANRGRPRLVDLKRKKTQKPTKIANKKQKTTSNKKPIINTTNIGFNKSKPNYSPKDSNVAKVQEFFGRNNINSYKKSLNTIHNNNRVQYNGKIKDSKRNYSKQNISENNILPSNQLNSNQYNNEFQVFCRRQSSNENTFNGTESSNATASASGAKKLPKKSTPNSSQSTYRQINGHLIANKKFVSKIGDEECIKFLGDPFPSSKLLHSGCQCENDCNVDELTLAFYLMTTLPDNEMPKHLRFAVNGRQTEEDFSQSDEEDDEELVDGLDECLPPTDAVYQQTMEENNCLDDAFLISELQEFLKNTSAVAPPIPTPILQQPSATVTSSGQTPEFPVLPLLDDMDLDFEDIPLPIITNPIPQSTPPQLQMVTSITNNAVPPAEPPLLVSVSLKN